GFVMSSTELVSRPEPMRDREGRGGGGTGGGRGSESPWRMAWRRHRRNRTAMFGGGVLLIMYLMVIFGSFLGVRNPGLPDYMIPSHPPTVPRFVDETGKFHFRPF